MNGVLRHLFWACRKTTSGCISFPIPAIRALDNLVSLGPELLWSMSVVDHGPEWPFHVVARHVV